MRLARRHITVEGIKRRGSNDSRAISQMINIGVEHARKNVLNRSSIEGVKSGVAFKRHFGSVAIEKFRVKGGGPSEPIDFFQNGIGFNVHVERRKIVVIEFPVVPDTLHSSPV